MFQFVPIASALSLGTHNLNQMNALLIHTVDSGFMEICTDTAISLMEKPVQLNLSEGNCVFSCISLYSFPVSPLAGLSGKPKMDICTDDTLNILKCVEEVDMGVYSLVQHGEDATWGIYGGVSVLQLYTKGGSNQCFRL